MTNRILLCMFSVFAIVGLAATSSGAEPADECLTKPKASAPAGKHWYYQTNRTTQRKCWYLGDEGATTVSAAPRKRAAAPIPADQAEQTEIQPPVANARAELIAEPQPEQPVASIAQPQPETLQSAPDGTSARNWALASRWPENPIAYSADRAAMFGDPARTPRTEKPSPALVAQPVAQAEQPSAAAGDSDYVRLAPLVATLILLVVIGGVAFIILSASRRRDPRASFSQPRMTPSAVARASGVHSGARRDPHVGLRMG